MKILETGVAAQTLKIIPRVYATSVTYILTNESTNVQTAVSNHAVTTVTGFLEITNTWDLEEDVFYELDVYDYATGDVIYRDKIFVTDQTSATVGFWDAGLFDTGLFVESSQGQYSINKDEYVSDQTYDNEFIIYD